MAFPLLTELVNQVSNQSGPLTRGSFLDVNEGDLILIFVGCEPDRGSVAAVTFGTLDLAQVPDATSTADGIVFEAWYAFADGFYAAGTTIQASFDPDGFFEAIMMGPTIAASELIGSIDQAAVVSDPGTGGFLTVTSGAATQNEEVVVSAVCALAGVDIRPTVGIEMHSVFDGGIGIAVSYQGATTSNSGDGPATVTGDQTETWDLGANGNASKAAVIVTFPVSAGSSPEVGDTGAGSTVLALHAAEAASESGTGTDAATYHTAASATDSGAGSDGLIEAAAIPRSDSGAGTDALSAPAAILSPDSGTGTQTLAETAVLASPDTGAGTDTPSPRFTTALADSGAGTDPAALASLLTPTDGGTGSEAQALAAAIASPDTGAGTDSLGLSTSSPSGAAVTDSGTGTEALALTTVSTYPESGAGSDPAAQATAALLADTAAADDLADVRVFLTLSDAGAGSDLSDLTTTTETLADHGFGDDQLLPVGILFADTGAGQDETSVDIQHVHLIGTPIPAGRVTRPGRPALARSQSSLSATRES